MLHQAVRYMQGIDGSSVSICRSPTLDAIVTYRKLVLLFMSGSLCESGIIISFRGDGSTGIGAIRLSCSSALCETRFPMVDP